MKVKIDGQSIDIPTDVFEALLDNSVARLYADFDHAMSSGSISWRSLVSLSEKGEIPIPLFFAPKELVEYQIEMKNRALLSGLGKDVFSVNARAEFRIADVELIVKDLIRKQELLKSLEPDLHKNTFVGCLSTKSRNLENDVQVFFEHIELDPDAISAAKNAKEAFETLASALENAQVLVGESVRNYMPQQIKVGEFSGLTLKDSRIPYIFVAGGDKGDNQEPSGRRLFTLVLLAVLVARNKFVSVAYNGDYLGGGSIYEFDLAASILMPKAKLIDVNTDLDSIKQLAASLNVTPTALTVRLKRLGILDFKSASEHLQALREEFLMRPAQIFSQPKPENAIRKYNGTFMTRRMLTHLDAGRLAPKEFRRIICLNNPGIRNTSSLWEAVWESNR